MADDSRGARPRAKRAAPHHQPNAAPLYFHHNTEIRTPSATYRVQRRLGRGGNGTTFLVTCTGGAFAGVMMAMKVFHRIQDARRRERFAEEIKFYRTIDHPSIIKLYDESEVTINRQAYPAAFVEYAPDDLFAHMVASGGQLSRIHALRLGMNVASGLAFLHSQEKAIVHRDIKPANILVIGGTAKLGDFGLAKEVLGAAAEGAPEPPAGASVAAAYEGAAVALSETESGGEEALRPYVAMPRFYRTPELVRLANGEHVEIDGRSDVFQFGCVFYQTLTGFNPQRMPESVTDELRLDVQPIRGDQGERLMDLVGSMLRIEPAQRPSAVVVLEELVRIHRDHSAAITALTGDDT